MFLCACCSFAAFDLVGELWEWARKEENRRLKSASVSYAINGVDRRIINKGVRAPIGRVCA